MYPFKDWEEKDLRKLLLAVLDALKDEHFNIRGEILSQKQIAEKAKISDYTISKAKKEASFFSAPVVYNVLRAISRAYLITYTDEGKIHQIGAFRKEDPQRVEGEQLFVYYYLGRDFTRGAEPKKAFLRIDLNASEVELTLFRKGTQARMRYSGEIKEFPGREFFLVFHQRQNLVTKEKESIPALCCFPMKEHDLQEDWYVGVYTGTESVGGLCVLERKEKGLGIQAILKEKVPSVVTFLLGHSRIEAEELSKPSRIKGIVGTLEKLRSYEGVYEAYVLESQRDREFIHKLAVKIYNDCRIRFYSKITGEQEGIILEILHEKFLVCEFGYNREDGYYDFCVILDADLSDKKEEIPQDYMLGIYGGVELQARTPIAGRILLRKTDQAYDKSLAIKIPLDNEALLKAYLAKEELLYKFLRGELDRFVDAPIILEKTPLLSEKKPLGQETARKPLAKLAGLYQCYHLSSDKRHIYHSPIEIKPNGDVTIVDQTEEEKRDVRGRRYYGKAYYFLGNFLAVAINKRDDEDYYTHLLFYVASAEYNRVKHFHGVSSSITSKNSLRASREVLVKIKGNLETEYSERIPIPLNGQEEPLYDELDKKYDNLASFLTGNSHNLILPKRDPDSPFRREENYGMLYFSSACYYAETGDFVNARKQMERAFQHGFRDRILLKKEMKNGMLAKPEVQLIIDPDKMMIRE